jgi:hypothetical protein
MCPTSEPSSAITAIPRPERHYPPVPRSARYQVHGHRHGRHLVLALIIQSLGKLDILRVLRAGGRLSGPAFAHCRIGPDAVTRVSCVPDDLRRALAVYLGDWRMPAAAFSAVRPMMASTSARAPHRPAELCSPLAALRQDSCPSRRALKVRDRLAFLSPEDLAQEADNSGQCRGARTSGKQGSAVIGAWHRHKTLDAYMCLGQELPSCLG